MSNARNLARIIADSSGAIASANLGNAVPADGSITTAKLAAGAVTAVKIASGAAVSNIGYTPANKAGDTFTGAVGVQGAITSSGNITAYGTV